MFSLVRLKIDSCSISLHSKLNFILTISSILHFSVLISELVELSDENIDLSKVAGDLNVIVSLKTSLQMFTKAVTYSVILGLSVLLVQEGELLLELRVVSLSLSHFVDLLLELRDEEVLLLACSLSLNTP